MFGRDNKTTLTPEHVAALIDLLDYLQRRQERSEDDAKRNRVHGGFNSSLVKADRNRRQVEALRAAMVAVGIR